MHKTSNKIIITVLIVFIFISSGMVEAVDFISLDKIEPGMIGYGKTVFKGTMVEEFPVEIVDVLRNQDMNKDLILIKAGGNKIDNIGGVAAGMSGSPIYINNKLAGAISYGWQFSNHKYALVTPINYMMKLFDKEFETWKTNNLIKYNTPLMVNGLQGRALANITEGFSTLDLKVFPGNGLRETDTPTELKPGSAISVQLVRGDINIASMGTLTYIEDDKILAFGHPFTNKGKVNFLLSEAYINGIIPSEQQPFKLGSPVDKPLGMISSDRGAGIAGMLNKFPEIIPLEVKVTDVARDKTEVINVQIVQDERLLTSLSTNIALQAIDNTIDRIGQGTARTHLKVMGNGLPDLLVQRHNMFYSRQDIASVALYDFYQLLDLICTNPFEEINIIDLQLTIDVSREDKVALVEEARVLNKEIYPGDELDIEITLHPYRAETFTQKVSLKLPEDIQPGSSSMIIEGGYTGISQLPDFQDEGETSDINQAQIQGYKNFSSMLNDYLEQPQNNDLIIQVYQGYPVAQIAENNDEENISPVEDDIESDKDIASDKEQKQSDKVTPEIAEEESEQEEIKIIKQTDYVLEGSLTLDIEIKEPDSSEEKGQEQTQIEDDKSDTEKILENNNDETSKEQEQNSTETDKEI